MAESESIDCPCSNIAIMQLFHELKQSFPAVPDQIVSKVIQENYHDKSACETILQKESHAYLQSYPGALISGNAKESPEKGSLCNQCPAIRSFQQCNDVSDSLQSVATCDKVRLCSTQEKEKSAFSTSENDGGIYPQEKNEIQNYSPMRKPEGENTKSSIGIDGNNHVKSVAKLKSVSEERNSVKSCVESENFEKAENLIREIPSGLVPKTEAKSSNDGSNSSGTCCCEYCEYVNDRKSENSERSHSCGRPPSLAGVGFSEAGSVSWNLENGVQVAGAATSPEEMSVHNYQVAVQYSMQPALPLHQGSQQRSFTKVNLSLRPPTSEPQPPIEIRSGQNLTYTTSVFDAKKGVQSQLQIRIGPGGGGTVSACRTYISSPQTRFSCRSSYCTPRISAGFQCQNNHHLKVLLEKQKERKDLLARELRKEKEKLRSMQNEVRLMKVSIAQKPSPHLLPKLKSEIEKLRVECERLTTAVDLYSDTQNHLPLGETDEEFYRNIYTGQRLQREGSWSCQLCTFRNHPLLSVCEECEMPRISLGTQVMDVTSHLSVLSNNNTSFCTGGGTSTSASLITAPLQER